jgi:hypothetical protein
MSLTVGRPARFKLRVTLVIALAVFAQESVWNFYDAQVPALLREHLTSAALIGLLMGLDNVVGVFVQPWIGNRSDRTRTASAAACHTCSSGHPSPRSRSSRSRGQAPYPH